MVLNITAYNNVSVTDHQPPVEDDDSLVEVRLHSPERDVAFEGLENAVYDVSDSETLSFSVESLKDFGVFLRHLASLAGYTPESAWENPEQHVGVPFYELVNFSDHGGIIGPVAAEKLYADFVTFRDQYRSTEDRRLRAPYDLWTKAFGLAANGGFVRLH